MISTNLSQPALAALAMAVLVGCGGEQRDRIGLESDLLLAPPAVMLPSLKAVPIDIATVDARVIFDLAAGTARAEATMTFSMGGEDGGAIFDLRQKISEAWLDDQQVDPRLLAAHDLGGGPGAELRVIDRQLRAGSRHRLRLVYDLGSPLAPAAATALAYRPGRLRWDLWLSDLKPGRYVEQWFPANLIYDRFALNVDIELRGAAVGHRVITNGAVSPLADSHWRIAFPAHFTALSPMLLVVPSDEIEERHADIVLPDGERLRLELFRPLDVECDLAGVEGLLRGYLADYVSRFGPYCHGDRFTVWMWTGSRSMEYEGATTTSLHALQHETFHSWFGRGIKPASQCDGWIDEAWTVYSTGGPEGGRNPARAFAPSAPPIMLSSDQPYSRITPGAAYGPGAWFFAGLADLIGADPLDALMAEFYRANRGRCVTTAQLRDFLVLRSGKPEIAGHFARMVYGKASAATIPDRD